MDCRWWVVMQSASGGKPANKVQESEVQKGELRDGDFPVAAGRWAERMEIKRESGGLGSKNGSCVEGKDGQGELQAGEKEGRGSRVKGARDVVAPTVWG